MQVQIGGHSISTLVFGTMRMKIQSPYADYYALLNNMFERGIDTHHISHEYESYALYVKLHQQLRRENKNFKHITKIAAPDFKDNKFISKSFEKRIDEELIKLGKNQLEVVQWMYRMENFDDQLRLSNFKDEYHAIDATFEKLKKAGKVLSFGHFPYTPLFADQVANIGLSSLIITYLNVFELSYQNFAKRLPTIAIRPFAAGKIGEVLTNDSTIQQITNHCKLTEEEVNSCLKLFPLLYPEVKAVILSLNNEAQLNDVMNCYNNITNLKKGRYDFETIINTINNTVNSLSLIE